MSDLSELVDLERFTGCTSAEIAAAASGAWEHLLSCDKMPWSCEACHEDLKKIRRVVASVQPLIEREYLEDLEAAGRLLPEGATAGEHAYLSTGCLHGEHAYCQSMTGLQGSKRPGRCKFCAARCVCECHRLSAAEPAEVPKP